MSASARQERAFSVYVELGPERSLAGLAAALRVDPARTDVREPPSLRTLELWSTRYRWRERLEEIDRRAREELDRQHVEWVKQHRERLRQEGLLLQQRGLEWLKDKQADNVRAHEAIRAIESGFRLEALALGEATERISLAEADDERLQRLSDDDLTLIIEHARQARRGSAAGEGATQPS